VAWIAERALPDLPKADIEELREMVASVERRRDRLDERDSADRSVAAAILAEACLHVVRLPALGVTGG
jgi:hypothetical protein